MRYLYFYILLFITVSAGGQGPNKLYKVSPQDPRIIRVHRILPNATLAGWDTWKDFIKRKGRIERTIIPAKNYVAAIFDSSLNEQVQKILLFVTSIPIDSTQAVTDIRSNHVRLFCGIAFSPEAMMDWDRAFEQLFDLQYSIVGDMLIYSPHQMISYNRIIAAYLDRKYGIVWRSTIRRDVLGINREYVD